MVYTEGRGVVIFCLGRLPNVGGVQLTAVMHLLAGEKGFGLVWIWALGFGGSVFRSSGAGALGPSGLVVRFRV